MAKYVVDIYRDGELVNHIEQTDELKVYKTFALLFKERIKKQTIRTLTKDSYDDYHITHWYRDGGVYGAEEHIYKYEYHFTDLDNFY